MQFDPSKIIQRLPQPAARWSRLFGLSVLVGILSGFAALGLEEALHLGSHYLVGRFADPASPAVLRWDWRILLLPALGGLFSGVVVQLAFRQKMAHGTDLLTRAFHRGLGALPLKGPLVKAAAAVGVISSGGSAGPEGPIAALGAGIGSSTARVFGTSPRERRIMLVAGCAAGIGAVFHCPLGGALFATGVLYSEPEFEAEAMVPSFIASVVGYSVFQSFQETFGVPLLGFANVLKFESAYELFAYALLIPLCALSSVFLAKTLRAVERARRKLKRVPPFLLPALGGLATGILACALPQVMDGRYEFVRGALDGALFEQAADFSWKTWALLFGAVVIAKCVATSLTVGSGASGGVLGPAVFIGGVVGAFLGASLEAFVPYRISEPLRQSLIPVGMAGVLAAGMRTPLAAMVMVAEMTGGYGLIVPLMFVCVSSYTLGRRWGLNDEQVRTSADSPAHAADAMIHVLESLRVSDLMERDWKPVAKPSDSLREMVQQIEPGTRPVFAVAENGNLVGLISVPDIRRIMDEPMLADVVIASDMMTEKLETIPADATAYDALSAFGQNRHDVLPVVSPKDGGRWVGMLARASVFSALQKRIEETQELVMREHIGLRALDHEGKMQQLAMAVSPVKTDRVQRLMVPLDAVGQTIRQADMRKRFGIHVVGIELPDGNLQFPPDLDLELAPSHRLVAIVSDAPAAPENQDSEEIDGDDPAPGNAGDTEPAGPAE